MTGYKKRRLKERQGLKKQRGWRNLGSCCESARTSSERIQTRGKKGKKIRDWSRMQEKGKIGRAEPSTSRKNLKSRRS